MAKTLHGLEKLSSLRIVCAKFPLQSLMVLMDTTLVYLLTVIVIGVDKVASTAVSYNLSFLVKRAQAFDIFPPVHRLTLSILQICSMSTLVQWIRCE